MRAARVLTGLATLMALTLAPARVALACSCASSGPPCQNTFQADAVFAGTVSIISPLPDDEPPPPPGSMRTPRALRVEFIDVAAFRGIQASTVSVLTPGDEPACGYGFKQGERYLVYATHATTGTGLVTGICSRTRPIADADDDLRFLQTLSAPGEMRARVYGTITHWERDLATGEAREHGAVPGVLVTMRGAASAFDAWTDANGRYEMTVPPGNYEVAAFPPLAFSSRHLRRDVELRDGRACFVADFGIRFDGRIRGVVRLASGEPAAGVPVQVMAADRVGKTGNVETLHTLSDAGGSFEFIEVPPGRYVVGVDLTRRRGSGLVFPTTFHPGTADAAAATVVQLDGGGHRELEAMTLPPPRRVRRLTGSVVFEDGSPASGVFVSLRDGLARWRQVDGAIKTDVDGTFAFDVHEGLSYIAGASYWDQAQRTSMEGTVGPFVVTGDTRPLKVVLSSRH